MPGFRIGGYGGEMPNTLEPARANRWIIKNLGPVTKRYAMFVAKDLTLPQWKVDKLEIMGGVLWYKFAKSIKWDDITISFYDIPQPNYSAFREINKWIDLVHTNENGIKKHGGSGYKMDCVFEELDGNGTTVRSIRLKNAWPNGFNWGKLTYTSSDLKLIELTLSYDWAETF